MPATASSVRRPTGVSTSLPPRSPAVPEPDAPASSHSVTLLIGEAVAGNRDACGPLWKAYFDRLAAAVDGQLRAAGVRVAEGQDAALSALDSFYRRAAAGEFPQLGDRDDLWRLLLTIVTRKAIGLMRREGAEKRGGGGVVVLPDGLPADGPGPDEPVVGGEEVERLLGLLGGGALRRVAELRVGGASNEEIAGELAVSVATVERKLARVRKIWEGEYANV
ncbi:MAG: RNA polymerase subunit sigma-70 [Isosphaera sp.]|nr:RNA polymerase subunit sigma-70 [Isosphaera sp.]